MTLVQAVSTNCRSKILLDLRVLTPFLQLDDSWEYDVDAEFPVDSINWGADLVSNIASALCSRCDGLRLWLPTCSFTDTLDGLKSKEPRCALCRILLGQMIDRIQQADETIYFFRVMSYITFGSRRGKPILSLCTFPGTRPSLQTQGGIPHGHVPVF